MKILYERIILKVFIIMIVIILIKPTELHAKNWRLLKNESFMEMLGMLDEYNNRCGFFIQEPDKDFVESFYPSEIDLANHFKDLVGIIENEENMNFNLKMDIGKSSHITFYSKKLSNIINSFYILKHRCPTTLNINIFNKLNSGLKLNYIKGVYLRYGEGSVIDIANGSKKLRTVAILMKELSFPKVELLASENTLPTGIYLVFTINEKLSKGFKLNDKKHVFQKKVKYKKIEIY